MAELAGPSARPPETFDSWALASGPALLRFAHLVTGNAHDAADAVQDALVAVYPRWVRLSGDSGQEAYARRVIVNRTISWWRRFGRREHSAVLTDADTVCIPDHASTAGDVAAAQALLSVLPPRQRAAITLRFYDDLSFADVARILDCPESTARSYVHRALARLRVSLDPGDTVEPLAVVTPGKVDRP